MIIVRAPLRITFGGAPTDLDSYSLNYGGFCISATINKYVYVAINRTFKEEIVLKYSETEEVKNVNEIKHPIFREVIRIMDFKTPQLEIVSIADVPSNGAGLGNSGAFTVALLEGLFQHRNKKYSKEKIAQTACNININTLKFFQGKQDEYASAMGGINCFYFDTTGKVDVRTLNISYEKMLELQDNLLLFYTRLNHKTNDILKFQDSKTKQGDRNMIENLHEAKELGFEAEKYLLNGDLHSFGSLLNKQWNNKEKRMLVSNDYLTDLHKSLLEHGAIGNKIIGSGAGGFVMAYTEKHSEIRDFARLVGLQELRFNFDFEGVKRMV